MASDERAVDEQATAMFHQTVPFAAELGVEVLRSTKDEVCGRIAWAPSRCTVGGAMHGGVLMALADSTGAVCAFLNLPEGSSGTTTIESKTNFLRAVLGGHVTAVSRPLHAGRRIVVVETNLVDEQTRLVAKVTQTQAVL
jgi:1,4-dihydroxy-2-naphthoyl-CoA hydrolase